MHVLGFSHQGFTALEARTPVKQSTVPSLAICAICRFASCDGSRPGPHSIMTSVLATLAENHNVPGKRVSVQVDQCTSIFLPTPFRKEFRCEAEFRVGLGILGVAQLNPASSQSSSIRRFLCRRVSLVRGEILQRRIMFFPLNKSRELMPAASKFSLC
jgi:hypothetical protein